MHESNTFIKKTTPVENFMNPHYGDFIQGKDNQFTLILMLL